jgi:hypothetical protein
VDHLPPAGAEEVERSTKREKGRGGDKEAAEDGGAGNQGSNRLLNELAFDSRTALVVTVSLVLIWSLLGLSSDPMAPAPQWLEDMGSNM